MTVSFKVFCNKTRRGLFYCTDVSRGQVALQMENWVVLNWATAAAAELACSANHYWINNPLRNVSCVEANILQYLQAGKEKAVAKTCCGRAWLQRRSFGFANTCTITQDASFSTGIKYKMDPSYDLHAWLHKNRTFLKINAERRHQF